MYHATHFLVERLDSLFQPSLGLLCLGLLFGLDACLLCLPLFGIIATGTKSSSISYVYVHVLNIFVRTSRGHIVVAQPPAHSSTHAEDAFNADTACAIVNSKDRLRTYTQSEVDETQTGIFARRKCEYLPADEGGPEYSGRKHTNKQCHFVLSLHTRTPTKWHRRLYALCRKLQQFMSDETIHLPACHSLLVAACRGYPTCKTHADVLSLRWKCIRTATDF